MYVLQVTTARPLGSQQAFSPVPSEVSGAILNESSNGPEESGWNLQNVIIKTQISNIEKFLSSERLCQARKRKYEEDSEKSNDSRQNNMIVSKCVSKSE